MSLHRAIIRQGTSIIDKQDIRTFRGHRDMFYVCYDATATFLVRRIGLAGELFKQCPRQAC